jgi:hypothetical protein
MKEIRNFKVISSTLLPTFNLIIYSKYFQNVQEYIRELPTNSMSFQKLTDLMHQWNEWNSAFLQSASHSSFVLRDQFPAHKVLISEYSILCIFTTSSSEKSNKVNILYCDFVGCDTV